MLARAGAAPALVIVPCAYIPMFYGLVHRINTTVFGNFLPRKAGSVLIYHKAAFYLLTVCVLVHTVGHVAIVGTTHPAAVLDALYGWIMPDHIHCALCHLGRSIGNTMRLNHL